MTGGSAARPKNSAAGSSTKKIANSGAMFHFLGNSGMLILAPLSVGSLVPFFQPMFSDAVPRRSSATAWQGELHGLQ